MIEDESSSKLFSVVAVVGLKETDGRKLKRKLGARGDDVDGAWKRLAESFVADVTTYLGSAATVWLAPSLDRCY